MTFSSDRIKAILRTLQIERREKGGACLIFLQEPILNSPYEEPTRHWELGDNRQPTTRIKEERRKADFITPIPKSRREQMTLTIDEGMGLSTDEQQYHASIINQIRGEVDQWRRIENDRQWGVTAHTAALLKHWRAGSYIDFRPFFCQIEAVETVIWLTEVAPSLGSRGPWFLEHLKKVNNEANPNLNRLALKMATGAGKTAVMAMLIAWQTVNAVRMSRSPRFTNGFLVVAPGITIKDRLRVLLPNDPDNYYFKRQLVPDNMRNEMSKKAKIVITNYHAFKKRDRLDISKGARQLLQGRAPVNTLETDAQMLRRVMPELMNMNRILIMNDEAHHCYREKEEEAEEEHNSAQG